MPGVIYPGISRSEPDVGPAGSMTIYDLLRKFCGSARWASQEEERAAEEFIAQLEAIGFFGSMADSLKSKESVRNV